MKDISTQEKYIKAVAESAIKSNGGNLPDNIKVPGYSYNSPAWKAIVMKFARDVHARMVAEQTQEAKRVVEVSAKERVAEVTAKEIVDVASKAAEPAVSAASDTAPVESKPAVSAASDTAPVESKPAVSAASDSASVASEPGINTASDPAPVESKPAVSAASDSASVASEPGINTASDPAPVESKPAVSAASDPASVDSVPVAKDELLKQTGECGENVAKCVSLCFLSQMSPTTFALMTNPAFWEVKEPSPKDINLACDADFLWQGDELYCNGTIAKKDPDSTIAFRVSYGDNEENEDYYEDYCVKVFGEQSEDCMPLYSCDPYKL